MNWDEATALLHPGRELGQNLLRTLPPEISRLTSLKKLGLPVRPGRLRGLT